MGPARSAASTLPSSLRREVSGPCRGQNAGECPASPAAVPRGGRSFASCGTPKDFCSARSTTLAGYWSGQPATIPSASGGEAKIPLQNLAAALPNIENAVSLEELRGLEGAAAQQYFDGFDSLILQQHDTFAFAGRNRRPPLDPINALLSFPTLCWRGTARRAGRGGSGLVCGLSAPSPPRARQPRTGYDGGIARGLRRPLCPHLRQPEDDHRQAFSKAGKRRCPPDRRWSPRLFKGLAAAQAADHPASLFGREKLFGDWFPLYRLCCWHGRSAATWSGIRPFSGSNI